MPFIYKITNHLNNKAYIGYTKQKPIRRLKQHLRNKKSAISLALNKYGIQHFSLEILFQSCDVEHTLNVMEPYFIKEHKTHHTENGYNLTLGGYTNTTPKKDRQNSWTTERKKKMSERMKLMDKSYMKTEEYKLICSEAHTGIQSGSKNPMFGKFGKNNPNSKEYHILYPDGSKQIIYGGKEKLKWLKIHSISPNTFQKMVHNKQYIHKSGIKLQ